MELKSSQTLASKPASTERPRALDSKTKPAERTEAPPTDRVQLGQEPVRSNPPNLAALTANFAAPLPDVKTVQENQRKQDQADLNRDLNRAFEAIESRDRVNYDRSQPESRERAYEYLRKQPEVRSRDLDAERRHSRALAEVDWWRRGGPVPWNGPRPTSDNSAPDRVPPGASKAVNDHIRNQNRPVLRLR